MLPLLVISTESDCVEITDHLWQALLSPEAELKSFLINSSCGALCEFGFESRLFGRQQFLGSMCSAGRVMSSKAENSIGCLVVAARVVPNFGMLVLQ